MSDSNKNKPPPSSRPNIARIVSGAGTPTLPSALVSRSDAQAMIAAATVPTPIITNSDDAKKWLLKKNWVPEGESLTRLKLADILFNLATQTNPHTGKTVTLEFQSAILSVAYLIEDQAEDDYTSSIGKKITAKLYESLNNINEVFAKSKEFMDATSTQQASTILSIQEVAAKQSEIVDKLATTTDKITASATATPRNLQSNEWPSLSNSAPSKPSTPSAQYNPDLTADHIKIQQRLILSSLQLFFEVDKDDKAAPRDRSIPAQRKMRDNITKSFQEAAEAVGDTIPSAKSIRSTQIFDRGAVLLEFETKPLRDQFSTLCITTNLLTSICPSARIKPRSHPVIFRFVPCNSEFDPSNAEHIATIESEHHLDPGSITSATWIKQPEKRSAGQTTANLKVICATPETANHLIKERIRVYDHLVNVRKDLRIPMRCNNCQEYGHARASCPNPEKCATCATEAHSSTNCTQPNKPRCISCGPDSTHASTSPSCPSFSKKCDSLDARFPENAMPYYPTGEKWTWCAAPPKRTPTAPFTTPRIPPPVDNGWANRTRRTQQGTLPNSWNQTQAPPNTTQTQTASQPRAEPPTPAEAQPPPPTAEPPVPPTPELPYATPPRPTMRSLLSPKPKSPTNADQPTNPSHSQ